MTIDCLVVTSAAYVGAELAAEFGQLPPAFLPVGGRRLFHLQRKEIALPGCRIVLTLPADFEARPHDLELIASLGIEVIRIADGLTLGQSVTRALLALDLGDTSVAILHGDTLLLDFDFNVPDVVSVHKTEHGYLWAVDPDEEDIRTVNFSGGESESQGVLSGFFSFSSARQFLQSLDEAEYDFIKGINIYEHKRGKLRRQSGGRWYDFGHLQTYYRSRFAVTTQRSFNGLEVTPSIVTKTSGNKMKMLAEANWYQSIPPVLRPYTPSFIESFEHDKVAGYSIANEYLCTLSDLFVFGHLPVAQWDRIFEACDEFLTLGAKYPPAAFDIPQLDALYKDKCLTRLEVFAQTRGIDIERPWTIDGQKTPSLRRIVDETTDRIVGAGQPKLGVMHGDFCFSNIFFDFRRQSIKVIDPRGGVAEGSPTPYGDLRYDVAKLGHSVFGAYDFIIAGYGQARIDGESATLQLPAFAHLDKVQDAFKAHRFSGLSPDDPQIMAIVVQLFLSMLPLHADHPERQNAFLANALRLYRQLDR